MRESCNEIVKRTNLKESWVKSLIFSFKILFWDFEGKEKKAVIFLIHKRFEGIENLLFVFIRKDIP